MAGVSSKFTNLIKLAIGMYFIAISTLSAFVFHIFKWGNIMFNINNHRVIDFTSLMPAVDSKSIQHISTKLS